MCRMHWQGCPISMTRSELGNASDPLPEKLLLTKKKYNCMTRNLINKMTDIVKFENILCGYGST